MLDPRFYYTAWAATAGQIADYISASVAKGDSSRLVQSVAAAGQAEVNDLTFADSRETAGVNVAGVCIAAPGMVDVFNTNAVVITSKTPRADFARAASRIIGIRQIEPGCAGVDPSTSVGKGVIIEPGCVVGSGAGIGDGARIGANTFIGPGVQIGREAIIGSGCSIRCALVGDGVTILSGARIGETGFGLASGEKGLALSPHFGRVVLQDLVSIGANSCVDRGMFGDTIIGEGSHIDNLCHIGHNTRVGARVIMAAFAGVSGSVEIGDDVKFGGRVGVKDHIRIGKGASIAAGAAVLKDVGEGETHAGYPAKPFRAWVRELAWLASAAAQKRPNDDGER